MSRAQARLAQGIGLTPKRFLVREGTLYSEVCVCVCMCVCMCAFSMQVYMYMSTVCSHVSMEEVTFGCAILLKIGEMLFLKYSISGLLSYGGSSAWTGAV